MVYAGFRELYRTFNTVYQICTPTFHSYGPEKGTISMAAVPGSTPPLSLARQLIGQSEAFQVPMRGLWQVTR